MKRMAIFMAVFGFAASAVVAEPTVFVVRHAEKAGDAAKTGDPDLSPAGRSRAELLARMLKDAKISAIFVTQFRRTQETAEPLAKELGLTPVVLPAKDIDSLLAKLRSLQGNAVVIGHGDTIPPLIAALGIKESIAIPESDFDDVFVVRMGDIPELLRLHY